MNQYPSASGQVAKAEIVNAFMRGVYGWMSGGLALTAFMAYATLNVPALFHLAFSYNPEAGTLAPTMLPMIALFAAFGMVFFLSFKISTMNPSTATSLFLAFSALNGFSLAPILMAYTTASVVSTFVTTAGMFGAMSLYGMLTKKDLTSWGSLLFMGLIGIIIAMVVNMFMQSSAMAFAISVIGVIIFLGLTAYDTQKLKTMGENVPAGDTAAIRRGTILGALTLYLDFYNLFLMLLRLMGDRR
ncbi:BAX inhibitor (BI)-1/YccA family protein [Pseudodesulfovibrio sp. F-1]|uniref:BAX inhibitor (BI)-1/YccA family protein n=1 Tax=Pseudodesulfovibrio alkaliphilus TaxID=2661613 RepID=A0A7K1KKB6_9BACT|nr:Bax inhibitor-1/YccA family protein [Pseudodesulfovibrio alkaliphilus]MUM76470.1 BAX inhibitor (BI)-1/YccA family protein [Pseudodesulfovibrio alkaliphilus]